MIFHTMDELLLYVLHKEYTNEEIATELVDYLSDEYIDVMDKIQTKLNNLVLSEIEPVDFVERIRKYIKYIDSKRHTYEEGFRSYCAMGGKYE